jgi:hypothetical protein
VTHCKYQFFQLYRNDFTVLAISNLLTGGNIGLATSTIDIYEKLTIIDHIRFNVVRNLVGNRVYLDTTLLEILEL